MRVRPTVSQRLPAWPGGLFVKLRAHIPHDGVACLLERKLEALLVIGPGDFHDDLVYNLRSESVGGNSG